MTPAINNALAFAEQSEAQKRLALQVRYLVRKRFDANVAIEFLSDATVGDIYIVGGSIRRGLFGEQLLGDMDIMIPNDDDRALKALDALNVPFVLNSHGHRRYRWNYLEMDIFQPREVFRGFSDVQGALLFSDLRINALALHWGSNRVLDPFQIVSEGRVTDPGINWPHWDEAYPHHVVVLAIRLAKIFHELPSLTLSTDDAHRLLKDVVPRIRDCNWNDVQQRFPLGKAAFLSVFETTVLNRIAESGHSLDNDYQRGDVPHDLQRIDNKTI